MTRSHRAAWPLATLLCLSALGALPTLAQEPAPKTLQAPQTEEGLERWKHVGVRVTQALSNRFPEVQFEVTEYFAHDAGDIRRLESVSVAGKALERGQDPLAALVAARGGWGPQGESCDEAILATVEAFYRAYSAAMNTHVVHEAPRDGAPLGPPSRDVAVHAPRAQLHTLADGSRVVTFTQFYTYDGGNHGTQLSYDVRAHLVPGGERYSIPRRERGRPDVATPPLPHPR